jgi:hypothetical protein
MVNDMTFDPYAGGALIRGEHEAIVANLEAFAKTAGIHPQEVCTSVVGRISGPELEYVRQFNFHRAEGHVSGLCLTGEAMLAAEEHMVAITGCLLRNYIDARLMTIGTLLDLLAAGNDPDCGCLLLTNFFLSKAEGGGVTPWQVPILLDLLLARKLTRQQTVLYVSDLPRLDKEYGFAFGRLIQSQYKIVAL